MVPGTPTLLKRVTFTTTKSTCVQACSPNIYKVAAKKTKKNTPAPPSFAPKPPHPEIKKQIQSPPIFSPSLLALSPDQLKSTILSTFAKEETIPSPAREEIVFPPRNYLTP